MPRLASQGSYLMIYDDSYELDNNTQFYEYDQGTHALRYQQVYYDSVSAYYILLSELDSHTTEHLYVPRLSLCVTVVSSNPASQ